MDPVTHAASGALLMLALPSRPATRWAVPLAALAAASPDIDIIFCRTPELFLALHRGITHSLALLPFFASFLALLCYPLWKQSSAQHFSFPVTWGVCAACLLLHIWLDVITTYGTMIFLPFSGFRVRLNAVFIVDLFLSVPLLLLALTAWKRKQCGRMLAVCGTVWCLLYPLICLAMNNHARTNLTERHSDNTAILRQADILPDVFSPLFWRGLVTEQQQDGTLIVKEQSLSALGEPRNAPVPYKGLPATLIEKLTAQSAACSKFFEFLMQPVCEDLPEKDLAGAHIPDGTERRTLRAVLIHDLRFGSGLAFASRLLAMRPNASIPFRLMLILDETDTILQERLVFSDSRTDSGWKAPEKPHPGNLAAWLTGLNSCAVSKLRHAAP